MYTTFSVVLIGFEELLYFIDESSGAVNVTVGVLLGTLSGDVMVQLTTNENSATGMALLYGSYQNTLK